VKDRNYILVRFGQKVRLERERKDISQEELGHKSKLHRTYIGMIERGEKNATLLSMEKIAYALDITLKQLMDF
jgi:transcriptional regulator with XRE-family HTH domain